MQIEINGEPKDVAQDSTVQSLLVALGLSSQRVAVERNAALVPRAEHPTVRLAQGDKLEIVHFVGGG